MGKIYMIGSQKGGGYGEDHYYVQSGVLPAEDGEAGSGCGF